MGVPVESASPGSGFARQRELVRPRRTSASARTLHQGNGREGSRRLRVSLANLLTKGIRSYSRKAACLIRLSSTLDSELVSAVVLAAGASTRMGTQKLLLSLGGEPLVRRVVAAICDAGF